MKWISAFALAFLVVPGAGGQNFSAVQPSGKESGGLLAVPRGIAGEVGASARDFATFRDKQWEILTLAQIAAASADAETSLHNFRQDPTMREVGISRFIIGSRPDAHKYLVAGLVEITVESVAGHYLRNHGPSEKWYWRFVWTLPQTLSLYGHAQASVHNARVNLGCNAAGPECN